MRSELVYQAVRATPNRLQLVQMVAKGARLYHNSGAHKKQRLAETINEVLVRLAVEPDAKFVSQGDLIYSPHFGSAPTEIDEVAGERGT